MFTLAALLAFAIYLPPLIIALSRKVPASGVAMNILLGWTIIGWLVALLMACRHASRPALQPRCRCRSPACQDDAMA